MKNNISEHKYKVLFGKKKEFNKFSINIPGFTNVIIQLPAKRITIETLPTSVHITTDINEQYVIRVEKINR